MDFQGNSQMMKPAHTHVKMRRLSAMLRPLFISSPVDPQTVATGLLERLWYYTAENHKSGFLQNVDAVLLSIEIGWYGDAEFLLDALINCGWIDKKDGVLSVHDWLHHCPQWVHGSLARSLQAKEAQDLKDKLKDDIESNLKKDLKVGPKGETFPEPCSLFPEPITLNPILPPPAARAVGYSEDFEAFWQVYPKKTGKGVAWESWKKRKAPLPELSQVLKSVGDCKASFAWRKEGGQFVPLPATWINQRRWEDEAGPTQDTSRPNRHIDNTPPQGLRDGNYDGEAF